MKNMLWVTFCKCHKYANIWSKALFYCSGESLLSRKGMAQGLFAMCAMQQDFDSWKPCRSKFQWNPNFKQFHDNCCFLPYSMVGNLIAINLVILQNLDLQVNSKKKYITYRHACQIDDIFKFKTEKVIDCFTIISQIK